jgi:hypothetical protein
MLSVGGKHGRIRGPFAAHHRLHTLHRQGGHDGDIGAVMLDTVPTTRVLRGVHPNRRVMATLTPTRQWSDIG